MFVNVKMFKIFETFLLLSFLQIGLKKIGGLIKKKRREMNEIECRRYISNADTKISPVLPFDVEKSHHEHIW